MHKSHYGGAKGKDRKKMVAKAKEAHKAKAEKDAEKADKRPDWLKKLKPLKKGSKS